MSNLSKSNLFPQEGNRPAKPRSKWCKIFPWFATDRKYTGDVCYELSPLLMTPPPKRGWFNCFNYRLSISSPVARSLLLSFTLSVRLSRSFKLLLPFLFVDGIEPLLAISSPDFWFRPPNAQNLLPKICTKLPITRLVWQIDRRCLHLPGGFRGWLIQWNHVNVVGPTLAAFGLGAEI